MRGRSGPDLGALQIPDAVALALAVFRIVRLMGEDDFPPTAHARALLVKRLGEDHPAFVALTCPWCASVYIAALALLGWRFPLIRRVFWVPALSAASGLLSTWEHDHGRR